jgi:hypothetical protein
MDEVLSPTLTIKVVGFITDGLKSEILIKLKNTYNNDLSLSYFILGKKNIIFHSLFFFKNNEGLYSYRNILTKNNKSKHKYFINNTFKPLQVLSFHTRCRAINRIGPHNKDVISIIFGLLLGDGYCNKRTGEGVRICIRQSIKHKDYLFFLYNFFNERGYCSNLKPRQYTRTIKNIDKLYYGFEFNTYTFSSFN